MFYVGYVRHYYTVGISTWLGSINITHFIIKKYINITSGCCYVYTLKKSVLKSFKHSSRLTVFRSMVYSTRSKCCTIPDIISCFLSQIITGTIISNRIHVYAESSSAVVSKIPQRLVICPVHGVILLRYERMFQSVLEI